MHMEYNENKDIKSTKATLTTLWGLIKQIFTESSNPLQWAEGSYAYIKNCVFSCIWELMKPSYFLLGVRNSKAVVQTGFLVNICQLK